MQWRLVLHGQHFRHFRKTADLDVTSEPLKYDKRVRCMEILTTEKTHTHTKLNTNRTRLQNAVLLFSKCHKIPRHVGKCNFIYAQKENHDTRACPKKFFVKIFHTDFHENSKNGLVASTGSWPNGRTDVV